MTPHSQMEMHRWHSQMHRSQYISLSDQISGEKNLTVRTVAQWNKLPKEHVESASLEVFKKGWKGISVAGTVYSNKKKIGLFIPCHRPNIMEHHNLVFWIQINSNTVPPKTGRMSASGVPFRWRTLSALLYYLSKSLQVLAIPV